LFPRYFGLRIIPFGLVVVEISNFCSWCVKVGVRTSQTLAHTAVHGSQYTTNSYLNNVTFILQKKPHRSD
jgi:hypothetical protein